MSDQHPFRHGLQQVVEMAVNAANLVANLESICEVFQDMHHVIDGSHLRTLDELSGAIEYAIREVFAVDIEPDVQHDDLGKVGAMNIESFSFTFIA